jgi:glutathione S-transferase
MKPPDGDTYVLTETYHEVRRPEKLGYTWLWEGKFQAGHEMEMGETQVSVEFVDRGGSTHIVLSHEGFPNAGRREGHHSGWNACLDRLATLLSDEESPNVTGCVGDAR